MTQNKLNYEFTLPDFAIEYNYSINFYLFFHGILFLSFFPLEISLMTFLFYFMNNYFLKYNFIKWSSYDVKLDS